MRAQIEPFMTGGCAQLAPGGAAGRARSRRGPLDEMALQGPGALVAHARAVAPVARWGRAGPGIARKESAAGCVGPTRW